MLMILLHQNESRNHLTQTFRTYRVTKSRSPTGVVRKRSVVERSAGGKAKARGESFLDDIARLWQRIIRMTSALENASRVSKNREDEKQKPEHRRQVNCGGPPDEVVIGCKS
jgi:hypothetical protein